MPRVGPSCSVAVLMAAVLAAGPAQPQLMAQGKPPAERQTPSGYDVPRYITLKFSKVNARAGPGEGHRLRFVYRTKGLPLQVVAETREWRRVCDPEGQVAWVHKRGTDGRRSAINMADKPAPLYRSSKPGAPVVAYLNTRALAGVDKCEDGWCRIEVKGAPTGWVREGALWGTSPKPQCR